MLAAIRILSVAGCVVILTGCSRFTEGKLSGTWRSEDENTVEEIACRNDHTFTSWTSFKNELTTPSVLMGAGEWHVQGNQLVVHLTKGVAVDTWSNEDKWIRFTLVKISNDALLMKNFDGSKVLTYKRLSYDHAFARVTRAPNDADLVGTWQAHYNTHDYEHRLNEDHSTVTSYHLDGRVIEMATGSWHVEGNDLTMDVKIESDGPAESRKIRWAITAVEPKRIAIKEGPVSYVLERVK
ncbi:MAG TPA: hypothetical protein VNY07_11125 [Chthoniobacterales bacterium]|jgi:hypothetical protein|nr:hypothetical protein [Chthoniobacterales bacterium]